MSRHARSSRTVSIFVSKRDSKQWNAWSVAHELGHVWDNENGDSHSKGLQKYVGSSYPYRLFKDEYDYGDPGNGPGATGWPQPGDLNVTGWNKDEDFAQSFAAYIYPEKAAAKAGGGPQPYGPAYNGYRDTPRGLWIASLIPNP